MSRTRKRLPTDRERFAQRSGRALSTRSGFDDRHYVRQIEHLGRQMDPWELDALMRGEDEEIELDPAPFGDEGTED
jgi:hypothetical protein